MERKHHTLANLVKLDDQYAVVLDQAILSALKIGPDTPLKMSVEGSSLIITPLSECNHTDRVRQALARTNAKYAPALKKLAE